MSYDDYVFQEDKMGKTEPSGSIVLSKDEKNMIGITVGGGAPKCPCVYVVQVFENSPASKDGTLESGDELVGVNRQSVKGKTKVEVAQMIENAKDEVTINYNKLPSDSRRNLSYQITMKELKYSMVCIQTADMDDNLGPTKAVLCNDNLIDILNEMEENENKFKSLVGSAKRMFISYFEVLGTYRALGKLLAAIGEGKPQKRASEAFTKFSQCHPALERDGYQMVKTFKPIESRMRAYFNEAIPDTKLSIKRYTDLKYEYYSYCLKVKEMDDEEYRHNFVQEPLFRMKTGNYDYRWILRWRQVARMRFSCLRSEIMIKLGLLEKKNIQYVANKLRTLIQDLAVCHNHAVDHLKVNATLFSSEADLSQNASEHESTERILQVIVNTKYITDKKLKKKLQI